MLVYLKEKIVSEVPIFQTARISRRPSDRGYGYIQVDHANLNPYKAGTQADIPGKYRYTTLI